MSVKGCPPEPPWARQRPGGHQHTIPLLHPVSLPGTRPSLLWHVSLGAASPDSHKGLPSCGELGVCGLRTWPFLTERAKAAVEMSPHWDLPGGGERLLCWTLLGAAVKPHLLLTLC